MVIVLMIFLTIDIIPGKFGAGIGGISTVSAAVNISNQDGIGYSGSIAANEVVGTAFTGYQDWPSEFAKGSSAFAGGVYDGTNIWMVPYNADRLIKVNPSTGEMTGYSKWPAGFTKGSNAFNGGVYDGTNIWLIPYNADQVIKVNATTGVMTGYSGWPGGLRGSDLFIGGTFDGTNIWLTPLSGSRLIKVNAATGVMDSYNSWPSGTTLGSNPFHGSIFDGDSIWLIPNGADRLIKVDPATGDMTGYNNWPITKGADAFQGGVFDGTNIWLIPKNATHVVKFDTSTEDMTGYNGWPSGFTKGSGGFAGGVYDGTNIWLVPLSANMLIKVDAATGDMTGFNNWPNGFTKGNDAFMGGVYDGKNVWMIPFGADRLMKFGDSSDLSGLTLSAGTLSKAFSAAETSYSASVGNAVKSIDVTPTTADAGATVTVNGSTVMNGQSQAIALNVGNNTVTIIVTSRNGNTKTYEVTVTRAKNANSGNSGSSGSSGNNGSSDGTPGETNSDTDTVIIINGKELNAGTITTSRRNEQTVTTITVDPDKLVEMLKLGGERPVVTIPVNNNSDVLIGELSGLMIKLLAEYNADLEIRSEKGSYRIPAQQINLDAISRQIGTSVALEDLKVQVEIASLTTENVRFVEDAARNSNITLIVPPLDFTVRVIYGNQQAEVAEFNTFIERFIAIPDSVDPSRITTGVVVESNGTVRHVPTKIIRSEGKYYTVINSLTNSTYSVIQNSLKFTDVENHWAKEAINNMGSRMIVSGEGAGTYSPDQDVTRAELTAIIVRGLGLRLEQEESIFTDVKVTDWYSSAIQTAYKYGLIQGFNDGSFRPDDKISREQAMVIVAKAMNVTELSGQSDNPTAAGILSAFTDTEAISNWALDSVAESVSAGIISGRSSELLDPTATITRAEVAVIVQRLLQKSNLIDG